MTTMERNTRVWFGGRDRALTRVELARLEGAVAALVQQFAAQAAANTAQFADHEARLRQGERWRYALPAALLTSVATTVVGILSIVLR